MDSDEARSDQSAAAAGAVPVDEAAPPPPDEETTAPETVLETAPESAPEPAPQAAPETTSTAGSESVPEAEAPQASEPSAAQPGTVGESRQGSGSEGDTGASPAGDSGAAPAPDPGAKIEESAEVQALRQAQQNGTSVEGRVIGWNNGGFHVVVGELTGFCPRSEMEIASPRSPQHYLDQAYPFHVLRIQKQGRRVVLSRAAGLKADRAERRRELRGKLAVGEVVRGKVASLTDFGAFVDLGGVQGLVHVSEISRNRVEHPRDVLEVGQEIEVKILKIERSGKRISLSIRALEPDPWRDVAKRYPSGSLIKGQVEKATPQGVFIQIEPGLTGLLPAAAMSLPREASPARYYPPGKEVSVLVVSVDPRRHRISLAPEGSAAEGSRLDYKTYVRSQKSEGDSGFNALAKALKKLDRGKGDPAGS